MSCTRGIPTFSHDSVRLLDTHVLELGIHFVGMQLYRTGGMKLHRKCGVLLLRVQNELIGIELYRTRGVLLLSTVQNVLIGPGSSIERLRPSGEKWIVEQPAETHAGNRFVPLRLLADMLMSGPDSVPYELRCCLGQSRVP